MGQRGQNQGELGPREVNCDECYRERMKCCVIILKTEIILMCSQDCNLCSNSGISGFLTVG